ncbi:hypothetical protein BN59_00709 [Legionella massiliensis]|uniref:Uncharacterized protein n=1 Tax=Legionella massiliensis TaxID=1034943 RepID=A0A078KQ02_9GAMM|nr:hypothetical protein [Legionella massiliensis]CDZ76440.1 hypothetical protein BN59_00709 [Legionella massiliensis]CEE12178.1 hypothetical protein BN1094_00709 [Legionella massiliensis]
MKRKLESGNEQGFFKKTKILDEANQRLAYKLVSSALAYDGKLNHIPSSGYYVVNAFFYTRANDFVLNFCDSIGEIPQAIKQAVSEKFALSKRATNKAAHVDEQPHLCCWEFCFLVLNDIGLVSKEQLDELCYIVHKINEKSLAQEIEITLLQALFKLPLENYRKFVKGSLDSLPSPGDFLVFQKHHMLRPYHASICIDNKGGHIELYDGECVKKANIAECDNLIEDGSWDPEEDSEIDAPESVYYVPVSEVTLNIQSFIARHQDILALKQIEPPKALEDIIQELEGTQYAQLVKDLDWADSLIV